MNDLPMRSRAKYLEQALGSRQSGITVGDFLLQLRLDGRDDEADYWQEGLSPAQLPVKEHHRFPQGVWVEPSDGQEQNWCIRGTISINQTHREKVAVIRQGGMHTLADRIENLLEKQD